jgi:hypothetical protein
MASLVPQGVDPDIDGARPSCRKAEAMNFVPGADWSERGAGTNAPGTALDRELQIRGSEHFSRIVPPWSCTATPVHDPDTGAIDLTGGPQVRDRPDAGPHQGYRGGGRKPPRAPAPHRPRWVSTDDYGHLRRTRR